MIYAYLSYNAVYVYLNLQHVSQITGNSTKRIFIWKIIIQLYIEKGIGKIKIKNKKKLTTTRKLSSD